MPAWLWIALSGALGSLSRYAIGVWATRLWGEDFPWGTLIVNGTGSFLLGAVAALVAARPDWPPEFKLAAGTGFMGAFTTFSTFSVDTVQLIESGRLGAAAGNVAGNLSLGLAAAFLGLTLVRALM